MSVWYSIVLYAHIFSVILSIGPYFVLYPLLSKIEKSPPEVVPLYLDSFRHTVRLTKHTGHILVTTGVLLAWLGSWSWNTPWIIATLLILVGSLFFLARAFSPVLRELNKPHTNRLQLVAKLKRALILYLLITMTMMWFMVAKPALWG